MSWDASPSWAAQYRRPARAAQLASRYKANIDAAFRVMERRFGQFAAHELNVGSPAPEMAVRVDAGWIWSGTALTEAAAQTVSGFTTPAAGTHRIDRVVINDTTGEAVRVAGTPATGSPSAVPPSIPIGYLPCCRVHLTDADAAITNAMIVDERAHKFPWRVDGADFDGVDFATRGASLTGISDSKLFTVSCWLYSRSDLSGQNQNVFGNNTTVGGNQNRWGFRKIRSDAGNGTENKLLCAGLTSAPALILQIVSADVVPLDRWIWVGISIDLADTAKRHLYFGDTDELTVQQYTNNTIDFTVADWCLGADADGSATWDGGIAELMFWPGVYINMSSRTNRRLFYGGDGRPVNPSLPGGAIATLGAPAAYFHLDPGEASDNFAANDDGGATGGAFTVDGALDTHASPPRV